MAKKKPLTQQQREELSQFWNECKVLPSDHVLYEHHQWEEGRLRITPKGHSLLIGQRNFELDDYVVVQLHDSSGNVTDLAHLPGDDYAFDPFSSPVVYSPTGYPRGFATFGDKSANMPVILCRSIGEVFGIMQEAKHPALYVVYFERSNLKYAIEAYKGRAIALPVHDDFREWLGKAEYNQDWVTEINTTVDAIVALGFPDSFYTELIGDPINKWLEEKQPHAPQNLAQNKPKHQTNISKGFGRWTFDALVEHVYLVYGTDTVWDNLNEKRMRIGHLRHAVGNNEMFKLWQEASDRKTVMDLVFEPSGKLPANTINLFKGLPEQPYHDASHCARIIEHIKRLCGYREDEYMWLLRWLAYPLQNLGAKMDTAVVMYGNEGPGKSILFEKIMTRIYGEGDSGHHRTIGQQQLESQFNSWLSKTLFALCEEVVSRSERNHFKGQLKHLVTGKKLLINEKMLPGHEESNHANFVFLSNSTIPLELDLGDRRYFVIRVDDVPPQSYFDELFDEINNNGIAAFYHFLMSIDMDGFDAHSKPPLNQDKQKLIDASLPNPVLFYNEWSAGDIRDGETNIPYGCCIKSQLFKVYRRWCSERNEFAKRDRDFNAEVDRYMNDGRKDICFPLPSSKRKTTRLWITKEAQILFDKGADNAVEVVQNEAILFNRALGRATEKEFN